MTSDRATVLGPLYARLGDLLRRHVRMEDAHTTDADFVESVLRRFLKSREEYVLDPGE